MTDRGGGDRRGGLQALQGGRVAGDGGGQDGPSEPAAPAARVRYRRGACQTQAEEKGASEIIHHTARGA